VFSANFDEESADGGRFGSWLASALKINLSRVVHNNVVERGWSGGVFFDAFINENQFWRARIKKCMNQKKIGHIGFKKKNVFRFVRKSKKKVEREKKVIFFRSLQPTKPEGLSRRAVFLNRLCSVHFFDQSQNSSADEINLGRTDDQVISLRGFIMIIEEISIGCVKTPVKYYVAPKGSCYDSDWSSLDCMGRDFEEAPPAQVDVDKLKPGLPVAVQAIKNRWRRGKVIGVGSSFAKIFYLDSGEVEDEVPFDTLHDLVEPWNTKPPFLAKKLEMKGKSSFA
jgi:hypothetical protein